MTYRKRRLSAQAGLLIGVAGLALVALAGDTRVQSDTEPTNGMVEWPDTLAGHWVREFLEAYHAQQEGALKRFVNTHYSETYDRERELADLRMQRGAVPEFRVHAVRADGEYAVTVTAEAVLPGGKVFGWASIEIKLSREPPHDPIVRKFGPGTAPRAEKDVPKSQQDYRDWRDLQDLLERVRKDSGAPGLAVAVMRSGKVIDKAVTVVRRVDRPDRIQIGDRFHLGSVAKPFTATMIGKLVEDELLRWDTTLGDALHDVPMRSEYRRVTVEQLLHHRGGIPTAPTTGEFADGYPVKPGQTPAEARDMLVREVLTEKPVKMGEYSYSNAGYTVAGYVAERVAGRSWEELMRILVFKPLKLRSAGFAWPATKKRPQQPHGHSGIVGDLSVQEIGEDVLGDDDYLSPAGSIHCSIEDLAHFVDFHLQGFHGRDDAIKSETIRRLHAPPKDGVYACGWGVRKTDAGELRHGHSGTAMTFYATIEMYPDSDLVIVATANCGPFIAPFFKKMEEAIYRWMTQDD
ncbi:MAG: serine hydrolase domain-containing protein [Planctomycetota bacterium]